jgi:hypothetical protein
VQQALVDANGARHARRQRHRESHVIRHMINLETVSTYERAAMHALVWAVQTGLRLLLIIHASSAHVHHA